MSGMNPEPIDVPTCYFLYLKWLVFTEI